MNVLVDGSPAPNPCSPVADHADLEFRALGFVVRNEGAWSDRALIRLYRFLQSRAVTCSLAELRAALLRARDEYQRDSSRLYVCDAEPCHSAQQDGEALRAHASVPISKTGCQGHCKQAPLVTLRVGQASQIFRRVVSDADCQVVAHFANDAARAGSLLVSSTDSDELRFDPLHRHEPPGTQLKAVRFLLGHFRGEGRFARGGARFEKELFGSYEAGGRFVALRMEARYRLPEGGADMHRALVIVGAGQRSGMFTGRAYTDGGGVRDYTVAQREFALEFEDDTPDHGHHWQRARKIISPTSEGYEERLEVDAGGGFTPYYTVRMTNVSAIATTRK